MRAAIGIGDGVRVTENLIVVAVVVLDHDIHKHILGLVRDDDGLGVNDRLVGAQLSDELLNAIAVEESLGLVVLSVIHQLDLHPRIQERQFSQASGKHVELEFLRNGEDLLVRLEHHVGASALGLADDFEFTGGFTSLKFHRVHLAIATNLHLEPF